MAVSGLRSVTLSSVQDNGGTGGGGSDTSTPQITASITLKTGTAPTITEQVDPEATLYYANGTLSGYSDYVNAIEISGDGKTLLLAGTTGTNLNGTSYLRVYARDAASGALTLLQLSLIHI